MTARAAARVLVFGAAVVATAGCGYKPERTVGVSRDSTEIVVHFSLCRGQAVTNFRFQDYGISYGSGLVGPVLWEISSEKGRTLELLHAGEVPHGFDETTPFRELATVDRVIVTDFTGLDVMSFEHRELRGGRILRADYSRPTLRQFLEEGRRNCRDRVEDTVLGFGLTTPVLLGLLLAVRRAARRARTFGRLVLWLWLQVLVALALVAVVVVWIDVLVDSHTTGAVLPLGILGVLTFGLPLLLLPLPVAALAAVIRRRRQPPPPAPLRRGAVVRLMMLALVASVMLAFAAELARPWTLPAARSLF